MRFTFVSLSLLTIFPLSALCQSVQEDWTAPTLPDRTSSVQVGTSYTISWNLNLKSWFPTYCAACDVSKVDLWVTGFSSYDYTYKIASGVNVVATSSYRWNVDIDTPALLASPDWVFRFVPSGAAANNKQQISSAGFNITALAEASRFASATSTRASTTSSAGKPSSTSMSAEELVPSAATTSQPNSAFPGSATCDCHTDTMIQQHQPPTTNPPPPAPPAPQSKAWIAGVTIAPILGIALGASLLWLLMRRRRKQRAEQHHQGSMGYGQEYHATGISGNVSAVDKNAVLVTQAAISPPVSELPHDSQPRCLQAGYQAELPAPLR